MAHYDPQDAGAGYLFQTERRERVAVTVGSAALLAALKREHPHIVQQLWRAAKAAQETPRERG